MSKFIDQDVMREELDDFNPSFVGAIGVAIILGFAIALFWVVDLTRSLQRLLSKRG